MAAKQMGRVFPPFKSKRAVRPAPRGDVEKAGPPPPGDPDRLADLAEMVTKPPKRK